MFRDRIVHHLYFNYTHDLFERTFIADSYSCIVGRGTHYGIDRLRQHIRQESMNWTVPCYAMNLDIRGYFMHINRKRLLRIATGSLLKMAEHPVEKHGARWREVIDMDFVMWLTEQIVMLDPMENCIIVGDESDWDGIDHAKCMRYVEPGLGLPIGNLTSQLYSNVYMNPFDQFVKRELGCSHYGRYVDDSVMINADREWLLEQVPKVREFLADELGLELHGGKLRVTDVRHGVEFLGAFVKPYREYVSNKTLNRIVSNLQMLNLRDARRACSTVNSYLGVLSHTASYHIRLELFGGDELARVIDMDSDYLKGKPKARFYA